MLLTRRVRFSASHRLHTSELSEEENRRLYGKCNNPHGHGHDYVLDVTVEGQPDRSGQVVDRAAFDELVRTRIVAEFDHRNLNLDRAEFLKTVPTTENLASLIQHLLAEHWTLAPKLRAVRVAETDRNSFTLHLS